jgi:hypothetical protein
MKYILLMVGAKAGVDTYRAWSEKDIQAHFAHLKGINKELKERGEFVANEGLAPPDQAKVVRAGTDGYPNYRRRVSRSKGVSSRLLDDRRRSSATSL